MSAEGYALKLSAAVVSKHAPGVWSWFLTRLGGANLLILGPGGAGKSSFIDYLLDGELRPAADEHFATTSITAHKQVTLAIGADKRLVFRVKRTTEIPGQSSPIDHANMLIRRRPTAALVIVDASLRAEKSRVWISEFSKRIAEAVAAGESEPSLLSRLIVAVNKYDGLENKDDFVPLRELLRSAMREALAGTAASAPVERVPILPCIAIRTSLGESYINDVITMLARRIKSR